MANKSRLVRLIIMYIFAAIVFSISIVILVMYLQYKKLGYEFDIRTYAVYAGALQAEVDSSNGIKRLYVLKEDCKENIYSGNQEKGFQIWYTPFSEWNEFSKRIFVEAYNRKMNSIGAKTENETRPDTFPADPAIEATGHD